MVKVRANHWRSGLHPRLTWRVAAQRAQRVWRISSKGQLSSSAARVGPGASKPRKFLSDAQCRTSGREEIPAQLPARDSVRRKSGRPDLRSHVSRRNARGPIAHVRVRAARSCWCGRSVQFQVCRATRCAELLIKNASAPIISASARSWTKGCECRIIDFDETPTTNWLDRYPPWGERNGGEN
jgi:hypothetical protein